MKNWMLAFLFVLGSPVSVNAGAEIMQILVFDWDEKQETLVLKSLGSGTAIDNDLVLTNRHVIEYQTGMNGEFMLLCQAQEKQTRKADCSISAGIVAVHEEYDVALLRVISKNVFLPKVKLSKGFGYAGQNVRIIGFPVPVEGVQNFGGTSSAQAIEEWLASPEEGLSIEGDVPTTTRGKVLAKARVKETGEALLYTDARVNFGNSGGAAFDQFGRYIGIPTFMDKEGKAFILEYWQLDDWVSKHLQGAPMYEKAAQSFFEQASQKANKTPTKSRWIGRATAISSDSLSRRPTSRRYNVYSGRTTSLKNSLSTQSDRLKSAYTKRSNRP